MNKYREFLNYFSTIRAKELPEAIEEVITEIETKAIKIESKPEFTENGIMILKYLRECGYEWLTAKRIAENLVVSSRVVSGALQSLWKNGYVDKESKSPVTYNLTEKGKKAKID